MSFQQENKNKKKKPHTKPSTFGRKKNHNKYKVQDVLFVYLKHKTKKSPSNGAKHGRIVLEAKEKGLEKPIRKKLLFLIIKCFSQYCLRI